MQSLNQAHWEPFDLVEAFQLGHAVGALHDLQLLRAMERPTSAKALARTRGLDAAMLSNLLEYVATRTRLVRKVGSRFVAGQAYSPATRFLLDLYLGGYGRNAQHLPDALKGPDDARRFVDGRKHARAFSELPATALGVLPSLIKQLQFQKVLDLGCGTAQLLIELARGHAAFRGCGVEANSSMLKAARSQLRAAGVGGRVRVIKADCWRLRQLPLAARQDFDAIVMSQVANGMFARGDAQFCEWLRDLRELFPQRVLLIADYYGVLGQARQSADRQALLQDFVQVISGQGVPPANKRGWREAYAKAGCKLIHVVEDTASSRFIHLVKL